MHVVKRCSKNPNRRASRNRSNVGIVAVVLQYDTTCKSQVNLLPRSGGNVTAVSTSTDEATAWEGAKVRAEEYCFRKGEKSYEIVDEDSKYQGDQKGGFAAGMKTVGKIFGVGSKDMNDYRVKVQFRCQGVYAGNGEPFAKTCLLYTSPSPRDQRGSRMPSSA